MTERLLTVGQVARRFGDGWTRKRTLRALKAVNRQLHGSLLVNAGSGEKPYWLVPAGLLEKAFPHLLGTGRADTSTVVLQRSIERQEEKIASTDDEVEALQELVGHLITKIRQLEAGQGRAA